MKGKKINVALAQSPCKNCENRAVPPAPDCHNSCCAAWVVYQEKMKTIKENRLRDRLPSGVLAEERVRRRDKFIKSDDR